MSESKFTYKWIIDYLKGLLSNRQRHELEREVMHDAFEEEAFEGLNLLSAEELEDDMKLMESRLEGRIESRKKLVLLPYFRIAASIVLLTGLAVVIYFALLKRSQELAPKEIAQKETTEQSVEQDLDEVNAVSQADTEKPEPAMNINAETSQETGEGKKTALAESNLFVAESDENEEESTTDIRMKGDQEISDASDMEVFPAARIAQTDELEKGHISTQELSQAPLERITARVVDELDQPLSGVNVQEKGTLNGTITNADGLFTLVPSNASSTLILSSVGFRTIELPSPEKAVDKARTKEAMLALDEVVVTGYSTQREANLAGSVSFIHVVNEKTNQSSPPTIKFSRPVPPNGSVKDFIKSVEDRLDYEKLMEMPGEYSIDVTLVIQQDGSVKNIRVHENIPTAIADEYKRCIAESQLWQPAALDGTTIASEVDIHFDLRIVIRE